MSEEIDNQLFAQEVLTERKTCSNCWHNREEHCKLFSCECATSVFNHTIKPLRWKSYETGKAQETNLWKRSV